MKAIDKNILLDKFFWGQCTQGELDYLFELVKEDKEIRDELELNFKLRKLRNIDHWENLDIPDNAKKLFQKNERNGLAAPKKITDPEIIKIIENGKKEVEGILHPKKINGISLLLIFIIFATVSILGYKYLSERTNNPKPIPKNVMNKPKHIALVEKHIRHSPNLVNRRGNVNNDIDVLFRNALNHYDNFNYRETIKILSEYISTDSTQNHETKFYLGRSYLHLMKSKEALVIFKDLDKVNIDSFNEKYENRVKLSLALALILEQKYSNSTDIINTIDDEKFFEVVGKPLIDDLESFNVK